MENDSKTVRIKVSPDVARIVGKDAPRELQLTAARGALSLSEKDLVTVLFFFCHRGEAELRSQALATCRTLPASLLAPVLRDPEVHPQLLDFIARQRLAEMAVMEPLLTNPAVTDATLTYVAGHSPGEVLSLLAQNARRLAAAPQIADALLANSLADRELKRRLGWQEPPAEGGSRDGAAENAEGDDEGEEGAAEEEELNLSKYQQALELGVAEKIKIAMSGDKEWRTIFLKDSNKLVSTAAMKNPRITDGEVLAVAKNKSSNDELIRLITLNKEWVKNYEIKKALIMHPKTPLPKALRYMTVLTEKDIKHLAKSRGVSQVLVNNARRMLVAKDKKR
jgi:hypothetical protein